MSFEQTNALVSFQHFINDILRKHLDLFCMAYIDDILVYSKTFTEHQSHIKLILQSLKKAGLYLKPEKSEFYVQSNKYLGRIISDKGTSIAPAVTLGGASIPCRPQS